MSLPESFIWLNLESGLNFPQTEPKGTIHVYGSIGSKENLTWRV